jgi:hypothetical protein
MSKNLTNISSPSNEGSYALVLHRTVPKRYKTTLFCKSSAICIHVLRESCYYVDKL